MSTVFDKTFSKEALETQSSTRTFSIVSSRVRDIILDDTHEKWKEFGEWNGIGTIFFEPVRFPTFSETINLIPAVPAFPNIKQYPLINELVPIVYLADTNVGETTSNVIAYYLPPINVWNSQVHNAVPVNRVTNGNQQNNDYEQTEAGSLRRVTDSDTDIDLGNTFNENNVINNYPLLPYEGDVIYEGRYSNSIRLGSTVKTSKTSKPNSWSETGTNGDPITIIRNGQGEDSKNVNDTNESWVPTLENINSDKSSVYLTSTQKIPLSPATNLQQSFAASTLPQSVQEYNNSQIILNSGRLVFNSKTDSIILNSDQQVHITAGDTVGIDGGKQITLASNQVYLGASTGDTNPVVLGDELMVQLTNISTTLSAIGTSLTSAFTLLALPNPSLQVAGPIITSNAQDLLTAIQDGRMLSKKVKTI